MTSAGKARDEAKRGGMMRLAVFIWIGVAALLLAVALTVLAIENEELKAKLAALQNERDGLTRRLDAMEADLAAVTRDLEAALAPQEIASSADFPILRAMARRGDTVATFAAREGTTEAVVRALNPWLGEDAGLLFGQRLWVPRPPGGEGGADTGAGSGGIAAESLGEP